MTTQSISYAARVTTILAPNHFRINHIMKAPQSIENTPNEHIDEKYSDLFENDFLSTSCPAHFSDYKNQTATQPIRINQTVVIGPHINSSLAGSLPIDLHVGHTEDLGNLMDKQRRRRESHNAVERRRRDHINEMIQKLNALVPDIAEDGYGIDTCKSNKGEILSKTVEYIQNLKYAYDKALSYILKIDPHWHPDK